MNRNETSNPIKSGALASLKTQKDREAEAKITKTAKTTETKK